MNDSHNPGPTNSQGSNPGNNGGYNWTPPTPKQSEPAGAKFFNSIRSSGFYRSEERWLGGVSGGLGQKYNVDPLVVRVAFVLLTCFSGIGLILYAAAWALLPEQRDGRIHAQELMRGNFDGAHIAIAIALLIGFTNSNRFFWATAWIWGPLKAIFWIALVVTIICVGVQLSNRGGFSKSPKAETGPVWDSPAQGPVWETSAPTAPAFGADLPAQPVVTVSSPVPATVTEGQDQPRSFEAMPDENPQPAHDQSKQYAWTPPEVSRPKVKSPGATQFAILLGVFLIITAGLLLGEQTGRLNSSVSLIPLLAGVAVSLGGLAVIFNGFRGYSAGSGGFFGIVGFIAALGTTVLLGLGFTAHTHSQVFSDSDLTPRSVGEIGGGYSFGAGEVNLDLTKLDISGVPQGDLPIHIPIRAGVGEVNIIIPSDLAVTANQTVGVGTAKSSTGNSSTSIGGVGSVSNSRFENDQAAETESSDIFLDISLGLGEITITEQDN